MSDETKRAQYDQYGHDAFTQGGGAGAGGFGGFGGQGGFGGFGGQAGGFGDIFDMFFGGGGQQNNGPQKVTIFVMMWKSVLRMPLSVVK